MKDNIFRKKSLERISSPEETDDYMKAVRPGMWLVIAAVVLLIIGAIIWRYTVHTSATFSFAPVVFFMK